MSAPSNGRGLGLKIPILRLPHGADLPMPAYATTHSAGMDLMAAVVEPVDLSPGGWSVVPVGISIALPEGCEAQVRPRSGLAARHGVTVLNAPGTVDADYRGEISVVLVNFGPSPFRVERGMRIAQMVVAPVTTVQWEEVGVMPATDRGAGGFGSTGESICRPTRKTTGEPGGE